MLKSEHGNMEKYQMEINRLNQIRQWAHDRNLIMGGTKQAQLCKLIEEVGELANGINKNRHEEVVDALGDITVVLVILAAQHDVTLEDCIDSAYNVIKDRKGKMVDGIFIREE
jgi:NTP pyrophosphatase (non-canonical NTP hydrolase)